MNKSKGFTLIEVVLALAIFAYAASSLIPLIGQSASNASDIEKMTFASWVANNRLLEVQHNGQWPPKNKDKGQLDNGGYQWLWQQQVVKTQDKNLREVTILVSLADEPAQVIYELTTFVSRTETAKAVDP